MHYNVPGDFQYGIMYSSPCQQNPERPESLQEGTSERWRV